MVVKLLKSRFAILLSLILLLLSFSLSSGTARADTTSSPLDSPQSYISFLQNYSISDANNAGVTDPYAAQKAVDDAQITLNKFKSLSTDEQQKYLSILNNPDEVSAIYNGDTEALGDDSQYVEWTENDEWESDDIGDDDGYSVPMTQTSAKMTTMSAMATTSSTSTRTITHTGTLGILGVPITQYQITGKYAYNSTGVTSALSTYGVVAHNYNPTVVTDLTYYNGYVNNYKYYGNTIFSYKIGIGPLGIAQIGNVYLNVVGDKYGKVSGSFYTK